MSRDFDDIRKRIEQTNQELHESESSDKNVTSWLTNQEKIIKDIASVKQQINDIGTKVDIILEILNSFTILMEDYNDNEEDEEDDTPSWLREEQPEDWNSYGDDEEDEDY